MQSQKFCLLVTLTAFEILFFLVHSSNVHAQSLKIGWIGPLTGNAAILGIDSADAVKIAVTEYNKTEIGKSRPAELILEDDQYETAKTVRAYNRLVHQQGIRILFVLTYGGLFAISELAEHDNVILIDPLDCNENIAKLKKNTFCVSQLTEHIGYRNAELAVRNRDAPVAFIYFANDPFMGVLTEATKNRLKELNVDVAFSESYEAGTADFKVLLLRAKTKGVHALYMYGYDEIGVAMRQAKELGLSVNFYMCGTITSPGLQSVAGGAAEGTFVSVWQPLEDNEYISFLDLFKQYTGRAKPNFEISTLPAFDMTKILLEYWVSKSGDTKIDTDDLRSYLYKVQNYPGLSGTISMSEDGAVRTLNVRHWRLENGRLVAY